MSEFEIIDAEVREILGAQSDDIALYTGAGGELVKTLGGIGAAAVKKKEDAAAEKKAKEEAAAAAPLIAAAQQAKLEADIARMKASGEADPAGPLHIASMQADAKLQLALQKIPASQAGQLMAGASIPQPSGQSFWKKQAGPLQVWQWSLVGVGAATLLGVGIHLIRRK